jgi:hypothetical protein
VSAAAWAKGRVSRDEAEQRLARMPESSTGHGVAVPFPYTDRAAYKDKHSNEEINRRIHSAPVVRVPLRGLHAIQHSVKYGRVLEYLRGEVGDRKGEVNPKSKTPVDHPIVIQQGGKRYLHDGHHRATAALLRGKTSIKARLVDFDEKS